jgi:hypothetical protein
MTRYPCECCGCEVDGLYGYATCDDCYTEPTDEETTSTATFADLLRLHGSQLTDLEPKKRDDGRWQVAA